MIPYVLYVCIIQAYAAGVNLIMLCNTDVWAGAINHTSSSETEKWLFFTLMAEKTNDSDSVVKPFTFPLPPLGGVG